MLNHKADLEGEIKIIPKYCKTGYFRRLQMTKNKLFLRKSPQSHGKFQKIFSLF